MNQKQKALAEKTIKLRYNSLRDSILSAASVTEERNPDVREHVPETYTPEIAKLKADADAASNALREALREENARRQALRSGAQHVRILTAQRLAVARDEAILQIAFQGEDSEMMEFLHNLPTPESVMKELRESGIELTKALPQTTGIGSRYPETLSE